MLRLALLVLCLALAAQPSAATGDVGGGWDPNGAQASTGDLGGNLDPDGAQAPTGDLHGNLDPNG